jgi:ABC-type sugar transport system permease subunit
MAPSVLFLLAFITYPLVYSFYLSFTRYNYVYDESSRFNGLQTYLGLFQDSSFMAALENTMVFALVYFFGVIIISFIIAVIINEIGRMQTFYQLSVYMPIIVPLSLAGVTFVWILDPTFGVLNFVLKQIGISPISWLSDSDYALFTLVGVKLWKFMGFSVIIFLAGLQSVPRQLYESAQLSGANFFQQTIHITIPGIKEYTLMASLYQIVQAMKVFELPFVATKGGPGNATLTLYLYSWRSAFSHFDMGNAAAAAYVTAAIILAATTLANRVLRSE